MAAFAGMMTRNSKHTGLNTSSTIEERKRRGRPMKFHRILIVVDSEPIAVHAADTGVGPARELSAEVALVHAIDIPPAYGT
jgi:hypothetical protein